MGNLSPLYLSTSIRTVDIDSIRWCIHRWTHNEKWLALMLAATARVASGRDAPSKINSVIVPTDREGDCMTPFFFRWKERPPPLSPTRASAENIRCLALEGSHNYQIFTWLNFQPNQKNRHLTALAKTALCRTLTPHSFMCRRQWSRQKTREPGTRAELVEWRGMIGLRNYRGRQPDV